MTQTARDCILLTVDVEDWFQVENFKRYIPISSWASQKSRVEKNTHQILDLFDQSIQDPGSEIQATFFVLGWVAERFPQLVREIHNRGHEVASHGYNHELRRFSNLHNLTEDLAHSKMLLEDIIGDRVYGYRAPSFSIDQSMLTLVKNCGYLYDSSYNSFTMHGRYGKMDFSRNERKGIVISIPIKENGQSQTLYELPISNITIGKKVVPLGGGGYFRLSPFPIFRFGIQFILKKTNAFLFYCHPWELDNRQPRVEEASFIYKFRHYVNLNKTRSRLEKLLRRFKGCSFMTCSQYLKNQIEYPFI